MGSICGCEISALHEFPTLGNSNEPVNIDRNSGVKLIYMESAIGLNPSHIRPLLTRRDLAAVADLVELCFADTMDADGRDYLRHLRRLSLQGLGFLGDSPLPPESAFLPVQGLVWEEDGRIVGNLTIIPFSRRGSRISLIANVATHPDYRRRGIARQLTLMALETIQKRGVQNVWLHVRDDNPAAQSLYRSIGFEEQFKRTNWLWEPGGMLLRNQAPEGIEVTPRQKRDWQFQSEWLDKNYPPEVTWNLSLNKENYKPGLFREIRQVMMGEEMLQLSARLDNRLIGVASWESTHMYADNIWVAADPVYENAAIQALLPVMVRWIRRLRPLAINYPGERGVEGFLKAGFQPYITLIWMKYRLR